jgi:hypothetical protein
MFSNKYSRKLINYTEKKQKNREQFKLDLNGKLIKRGWWCDTRK